MIKMTICCLPANINSNRIISIRIMTEPYRSIPIFNSYIICNSVTDIVSVE